MSNGIYLQRGLIWQRVNPRFFIWLLFTTLVHPQSDSGNTIIISAGTAYVDLFRQRAERSSTTILSNASFINGSVTIGKDTLTISYQGTKHYASFRQQVSNTNFSLTQQLHHLDVQIAGEISIVGYRASIGSSIFSKPEYVRYGIGCNLNPWNHLFELSADFHHAPVHLGSTILFHDYLVHFSEHPQSSQWLFSALGKPTHNTSIKLAFSTSKRATFSPVSNYGTSSINISKSAEANIDYRTGERTNINLKFYSAKNKIDATLELDKVSFGTVQPSMLNLNQFAINARAEMWTHLFSFHYAYNEVVLSGSGSVESWPFTTFASSIIRNRLLFQSVGNIKHHVLSISTSLSSSLLDVVATAGYHRIKPDIIIEHWEPEFLVFGMKNFSREPFSVIDSHLCAIALSLSFPFLSSKLNFFAEQFIPLSVSYRSYQSIQPVPPTKPVTTVAPSTDGGRRFAVILQLHL